MPWLQSRRQATSQPREAIVEFDWAHPIFQGDVIVYCNGVGYRPNKPTVMPRTHILKETVAGMERGASDGRVVVVPLPSSMPKTVVFVGEWSMRCSNAANNNYHGVVLTNSGQLVLGTGGVAGASSYRSATLDAENNRYASVYKVGSYTGTDWKAWNGGREQGITYAGTGASYSASGSLTLGWSTAIGAAAETRCALLIISTAEISDGMAQFLSENPWQVCLTDQRSFFATSAFKPAWARNANVMIQ